jgi:ribosomal protein S18 acetylase RimI-like enzyme
MPVVHEELSLEYRRAGSLPMDELVAALNRCFEGYLVTIRLDPQALFKAIRVDSIDLPASVAAQSGGKTVAVALVARRGWNCRLAAMAIDPDFRGKRIGTKLTEFLLRTARERGYRHFEYAGLEEIDSATVAAAVSRWGVLDLPWQISPHALTALGPPHRAFRLGPALALLSDPAAETITFSALVVDPDQRRRGWATRLVRALRARFPGKKWRFSIVIPEEIPEEFFSKLNFRKERLTQIQMARTL